MALGIEVWLNSQVYKFHLGKYLATGIIKLWILMVYTQFLEDPSPNSLASKAKLWDNFPDSWGIDLASNL